MQDLRKIARRITLVLFAEQGLSSAAFIAAATLNPIVAAELSGNARFAGVPAAVFLLAGALAAGGWGVLNDAMGRRGALVLGLLIGGAGGGTAFLAIATRSLPTFLLAQVMLGAANSAVQLARFIAADVNLPHARGRAISYVVVGGTVGSVIGPFLTGPAGDLFRGLAGSELAGAYGVSLGLFLAGGLLAILGLRPEPSEISRQLSSLAGRPESSASAAEMPRQAHARRPREIFRQPGAATALTAMVVGQLVMVMVMVITALHMKSHEHSLGEISVVISAHTFGMYAFSVVSGQLVDRWGRGPVIMLGAAMLVLACTAATVSPAVLPLGVALFFLGLGWNLCYVGGSALLSDELSPQERARTQGLNDLMVGLASATGSLSSGLIFATLGYAVMAYIGGLLALLPLVATAFWIRRRRQILQVIS